MEEVHCDIKEDKGKDEADASLAGSEPPRAIEQVRDIGNGIKNVFLMVAEDTADLPSLVKWSGYSCPIILHAQRLVSGTPLVSLAVGECLQPGFVTSKLGAEETGANGPFVIRCMLEMKKKNQSTIAIICSLTNTSGTADEKLMVLRIKTDMSDALSSTPCLEEPPYAPSLELLMHTIQQTALAQEDTRGAKSSLLPPGESRVAKKMPQVKTETVKEEDVVVVPDQKAAILEEHVKDIRTALKNFVAHYKKVETTKPDTTKPMTKLVAAMEKNTAALEKFQAGMRSLEEVMQRCTDAFEDQQRRDVSNDTRELNREETVMRINNGGTRYVVQGGKVYGSHGTEINRNTDGSFQLRPPMATRFNQARQIALDNFDIDVDEEEPAPPSRNNATTPKSATKKRARPSEEESSFTWYCECEDVEHSSNTKFCRSCKTKQSADRRLH